MIDDSVLDDLAKIKEIDSGQMLEAVASSGAQMREAVNTIDRTLLNKIAEGGKPRAIVVAGMGGSGVSGDPSGSVALGPVLGKQGEGFGETVVRDLILSEMYRQNYWNDDPRIREITLGGAPLDVISRTGTYGRFYVLHSVPRFNNPTGTFDNDQYLLELVATVDTLCTGPALAPVPAADLSFASAAASNFATDMAGILSLAGSPVTLTELL